MSRLPDGIIPASLTPCDPDGAPATDLLIRHCQSLVERGCSGVLLLGTTGEGNSFSAAERKTVLEVVSAEMDPRSILVSTGTCNLPETIDLTRHAVQCGVNNVLIMPPFYYRLIGQSSIVHWFSRIIEAVNAPKLQVYYYDFPKMSGIVTAIPTIAALHEKYPATFVGMKDSGGELQHMLDVLDAIPGFRLYSGSEEFTGAVVQAGGAGCISATLNYDPVPAVEVFNAATTGLPANEETLHSLYRTRKAFEKYPFVSALKGVLSRVTSGVGWENMRPPILPLDEQDVNDLIDLLTKSNKTRR